MHYHHINMTTHGIAFVEPVSDTLQHDALICSQICQIFTFRKLSCLNSSGKNRRISRVLQYTTRIGVYLLLRWNPEINHLPAAKLWMTLESTNFPICASLREISPCYWPCQCYSGLVCLLLITTLVPNPTLWPAWLSILIIFMVSCLLNAASRSPYLWFCKCLLNPFCIAVLLHKYFNLIYLVVHYQDNQSREVVQWLVSMS